MDTEEDFRLSIVCWMKRWMPFVILAVMSAPVSTLIYDAKAGAVNWVLVALVVLVAVLGWRAYRVWGDVLKTAFALSEAEKERAHARRVKAVEREYSDQVLKDWEYRRLANGLASLLHERSAQIADLEGIRSSLQSERSK